MNRDQVVALVSDRRVAIEATPTPWHGTANWYLALVLTVPTDVMPPASRDDGPKRLLLPLQPLP